MSWKKAPLAQVAKIVSGATPSTSNETYWDGDVSWVTPKDLSDLKGEKFLNNTPRTLTTEGLKACSAEVLPPLSVLFSSRAPIGLVAINTIPVATNQGFKSFIPDPKQLDAGYLYHWLTLNRPALERLGVGATFKEVSKAIVARVEIPVPPLEEQRRIAAMLDKAEEIRAKRRAAIALLDQLPQAIFLEMFGDPKINAKRFGMTSFGQMITEMRGGANLAPEDFTDEGFPILHKGAIKANGEVQLDTKKKTFVSEQFAAKHLRNQADRDYLVVTLRDLVPTGPAIGFIADLEQGPSDSYVLSQGAYAFKVDLDRVNPKYLVALSNMPTFRHVLKQNAVGSTQIHIRTPIFQAITFPLPPADLQALFANRITSIHHTKAAQQAALAELDFLLSSLQHRAFNKGGA